MTCDESVFYYERLSGESIPLFRRCEFEVEDFFCTPTPRICWNGNRKDRSPPRIPVCNDEESLLYSYGVYQSAQSKTLEAWGIE